MYEHDEDGNKKDELTDVGKETYKIV